MTAFAHGLVKKSRSTFGHGLVHRATLHPAGKVTAIDEKTGLPIVRRDAAHSPITETPPIPTKPSPIGKEESKTGRDILHASNDPDTIAAKVKAEHEDIKDRLHQAISTVKGAKIHGSRDEKPEERVDEKIEDEGQNARTIPDFSGFRVAVDSHEAHHQAAAAIRGHFKVVREKDEFENGAPDTAFHAHMMQVQNPGSDVSHEVQVLPKQVADTAESTHGLYEKARTGDKGAAAEMKGHNEDAWKSFNGTQEPKSKEVSMPKAQIKTGVTVRLQDGRIGIVKGISPKGDVEVKLSTGGRVKSNRLKVQVVESDMPVKGVTVGTPGHARPTSGAVAVDMDKTMAEYDGYKGPTVIGKPIAAQITQVKKMIKDGKDVWVYTARVEHPEAIPAIKAWTKEHIGEELPITNIKYPEFAKFIDDRAQLPVQMMSA